MQRLQGLCEKFILSRLEISNVVPMLAKAAETHYYPVKHACYQLLAKLKPTSNPELAQTFSPRLIAALSSDQGTMALAFNAAAGSPPAMDASSAFTEIPPSQLPRAMASLWQRADGASQDSGSGSSKKTSKKSKKSKKRSNAEAFAFAPPDCTVEIGSGGGGTTLQADQFVLAARSDYFRASLSFGGAQEGSERRVELNPPPPLPSATATRGILRFLYTGSLADMMADDGAAGGAPLGPDDALDVLHVTGQSDEGGGYLQLRDNKRLRDEARRLINEGICEENAFGVLRRADAMGQQEAKNVILQRLMVRGCYADPSGGQGGGELCSQGEGGWWSDKQEIHMCHEVIRAILWHTNSTEAEDQAGAGGRRR